MYEKLTERMERIVSIAATEARNHGQDAIGPEHLLLGIALEGGSAAAKALNEVAPEVGVRGIRDIVLRLLPAGAYTKLTELPYSDDAKFAIRMAFEYAMHRGDSHTGPEHVLHGLTQCGIVDSAIYLAFKNAGIKQYTLKKKIEEVIGEPIPEGDAEGQIDMFDAPLDTKE